MGKRRQTPEQIISKLREAEVELARGMKVPEVCKKLGTAEYTYYRWRIFGGAAGTRRWRASRRAPGWSPRACWPGTTGPGCSM